MYIIKYPVWLLFWENPGICICTCTSLSPPRSSRLLTDASGEDPTPPLPLGPPTTLNGELWTFSVDTAERAKTSSSCLAWGEEGVGGSLWGEPDGWRFKKLPHTPLRGEGLGRTTESAILSGSWFWVWEWDWVSENWITSDWAVWASSSTGTYTRYMCMICQLIDVAIVQKLCNTSMHCLSKRRAYCRAMLHYIQRKECHWISHPKLKFILHLYILQYIYIHVQSTLKFPCHFKPRGALIRSTVRGGWST